MGIITFGLGSFLFLAATSVFTVFAFAYQDPELSQSEAVLILLLLSVASAFTASLCFGVGAALFKSFPTSKFCLYLGIAWALLVSVGNAVLNGHFPGFGFSLFCLVVAFVLPLAKVKGCG